MQRRSERLHLRHCLPVRSILISMIHTRTIHAYHRSVRCAVQAPLAAVVAAAKDETHESVNVPVVCFSMHQSERKAAAQPVSFSLSPSACCCAACLFFAPPPLFFFAIACHLLSKGCGVKWCAFLVLRIVGWLMTLLHCHSPSRTRLYAESRRPGWCFHGEEGRSRKGISSWATPAPCKTREERIHSQ